MSRGKFTGESIRQSATAAQPANRVEKGFIGAHADIGGGFKDDQLASRSELHRFYRAVSHFCLSYVKRLPYLPPAFFCLFNHPSMRYPTPIDHL